MIRTLSGRLANPRPISLYQRARVLLGNRGVYVPALPNRKLIITALGRYEGLSTPNHINVAHADRIITAWVEKHEESGRSASPASAVTPASFRSLKLSKEMRAQMARCNPSRLPQEGL